jgi:hypothetical protein
MDERLEEREDVRKNELYKRKLRKKRKKPRRNEGTE